VSSPSSWVEIEPAVLVGALHRVQVEEAVEELQGDAAALKGAVLADNPRPPAVQDEVVQPDVDPDDVVHRAGVVIRRQQERDAAHREVVEGIADAVDAEARGVVADQLAHEVPLRTVCHGGPEPPPTTPRTPSRALLSRWARRCARHDSARASAAFGRGATA
jgi:hypothetical protein